MDYLNSLLEDARQEQGLTERSDGDQQRQDGSDAASVAMNAVMKSWAKAPKKRQDPKAWLPIVNKYAPDLVPRHMGHIWMEAFKVGLIGHGMIKGSHTSWGAKWEDTDLPEASGTEFSGELMEDVRQAAGILTEDPMLKGLKVGSKVWYNGKKATVQGFSTNSYGKSVVIRVDGVGQDIETSGMDPYFGAKSKKHAIERLNALGRAMGR